MKLNRTRAIRPPKGVMIIDARILYAAVWIVAAVIWLVCIPFVMLSDLAARVLIPFGR